MPTTVSRLFAVGKCEKHWPQFFFCGYDKTQDLCQLTCLTLHLHQIWWLKLEKWIQDCQNWSPHSMVHYAHIYWGRTSIIELIQDLRAMNVLAIFQNDPWKFTDVRALTVIFYVRSWKMRKKFGDYENTRNLYWLPCYWLTFVANLVTLAWKMSSGMPKEASSSNGPLCACLMRQNLHDRTRPKS